MSNQDMAPESVREPLRRRGLRYLESSTSRHGKACFYVRRSKNERRIRIRAPLGSPEFMRAYEDALKGIAPEPNPDMCRLKKPAAGWTNIYVIFVVHGRHARVKIGIAKSPLKRMRELQIGATVALRVYDAVPVREWAARALEKKVHADLAERRIRGEWFAISPQEALKAIHQNLEPTAPVPTETKGKPL